MSWGTGSAEPAGIDSSAQDAVQEVVDRLWDDYGDYLARGTLRRCAMRCAEALARRKVQPAALAERAGRLARLRIEARLRDGFWSPVEAFMSSTSAGSVA